MRNQVYIEGRVWDFTNTTGADLAAGDPVLVGDRLGVCAEDILQNATGSVLNEGVFTLTKDTAAGSGGGQGSIAYWIAATKKVSADSNAGANKAIGTFHSACVDADTTANVKLSEA